MAPTLEEFTVSVAQRALEHQEQAVAELRSRTSTLLAASTLTASLFGSAAVERGGLSWANLSGTVLFCLVVGLSGLILLPRRLRLVIDCRRMYAALYREDADSTAYLLLAAYAYHDAYRSNVASVRRIERHFTLAVAGVGGQTLMWALGLALS